MNLPDNKKEKVKKTINNNSYTKQIFNLNKYYVRKRTNARANEKVC